MKAIFGIIAVLLVTISANCQNSLTRKVSVSGFTGDTVIMYIDNMDLQGELPKPRNSNNEIVGIYGFKLSSAEGLLRLVTEIFSKEEIQGLISSNSFIRTVCLPNGKILSVSFGFFGNEPNVCLSKLEKLSRIIKEEFTLKIEFEEEIERDGYIKYSYKLSRELSKFIE